MKKKAQPSQHNVTEEPLQDTHETHVPYSIATLVSETLSTSSRSDSCAEEVVPDTNDLLEHFGSQWAPLHKHANRSHVYQ